jgi:hypothetical protein
MGASLLLGEILREGVSGRGVMTEYRVRNETAQD